MSERDIKEIVKEKYGQAALRVTSGATSCCGSASSRAACDPITSNLYGQDETAELPEEAVAASLGCGNPTALAELEAGRDGARSGLRAAASTCCSRPSASDRPARRTAWT